MNVRLTAVAQVADQENRCARHLRELPNLFRDRVSASQQRMMTRHEAPERGIRSAAGDAPPRAAAHGENGRNGMPPPRLKRRAGPEVEMADDVANHHAEVEAVIV